MKSALHHFVLLFATILISTTANASGNPPCALDPTNNTVTMCSPVEGAVVSSPFEVWAGTTSTAEVVAMKIYLDGASVYQVNYFQIEGAIVNAADGPHRLTVRAWHADGSHFSKTVNITVGSGGGAPCTLNTANPSVTICAPAAGATVDSPVRILAGTTSSKTVSAMKAYVDGNAVFTASGGTLDTSVALAAGTHSLTVRAWHTDGTNFSSSATFSVGGGGGGTPCTPSNTSPLSVTICTPVNGATVASPVRVQAVANDTQTVSAMRLYVDSVSTFTTNSNSLDTTVTLAAGAHELSVNAWNVSGGVTSKSITVTVGSGGGEPTSCAAPASGPAINVCSPAAGSTVSSPVRFLATGNDTTSITRMEVWRNGSKLAEQAGATIDKQVTLANGATLVTFVMVNSAGGIYRKDVSFTGGTTTTPPPAGVTVTPKVAVVTQTTQQFTAGTAVRWFVDDIEGGSAAVGTISADGLYTPPAVEGTHVIKAVSAADETKSGTAKVHVSLHPGVYTYHYDNQLLGANTREWILTPENVNPTQFGKLCQYTLDQYTFTQPLYVPNVEVAGKGRRNVVFVGTGKNTLYAFDADCKSTTPLWTKSFINPAAGITPIPYTDAQSSNNGPEIGITGTPVIDANSLTMYLVTAVKDNGTYKQYLHAVDIASGAERAGSPRRIELSVPGTGDNNDGAGRVHWNALRQNQRPALMLHNGLVYVGWGSHHIIDPWHGWLAAYRASDLALVSVFNSTPDRRHAGIWMGGAGPSTDGTSVYVVTGQGSFTANLGGRDYGDSVVKLTAEGLAVQDYFTPYNQQMLNDYDLDLGASAATILPEQAGTATPRLIVLGSKNGDIYLLNRDNLGKFNTSGDTQIVQKLTGATGSSRGTPTYWNSYVYFAGAEDVLKAFRLVNGKLTTTPVSKATTPTLGSRGAMPIVSANGTSNGIVWIAERVPGEGRPVRAYDATDLTKQLWNSDMNATRDSCGTGQKFSVPTVVNGRVYVVTLSKLIVYGPLQ